MRDEYIQGCHKLFEIATEEDLAGFQAGPVVWAYLNEQHPRKLAKVAKISEYEAARNRTAVEWMELLLTGNDFSDEEADIIRRSTSVLKKWRDSYVKFNPFLPVNKFW